MDAATLNRDPFMPRPPKGRGLALALALLAHVLLIAGLAFGVHWRSFEPNTVAAELWSAVPQAAAPRAVEPPPTPTPTPVPTPTPPEVRKPEPVVKHAEPVAPPKPPPPALPDPQIAIEQAKREAAKRALAEQAQLKIKREKAELDKAARAKAALEKQRAQEELAQKQAQADKLKAEQEKAQAAKRTAADAAARTDYLKRMLGQAGATGGPTDTGTAARSRGTSASYAGRIMARIKPNIVFSDTVDGNPMATVEVTLAPDGTIVGKLLVKSSGVKS
ncbi:MAG TPA: cell envelope integrity protein TolA, partial [Burkholderiaceae bacterium]